MTSEMVSLKKHAEKAKDLIHRFDDARGTLATAQDILFRFQLCGVNATLEANRTSSAGAHQGIIQEIQSLSLRTEAWMNDLGSCLTSVRNQLMQSMNAIAQAVASFESAHDTFSGSSEKADETMTHLTQILDECRLICAAHDKAICDLLDTMPEAEDATQRLPDIRTEAAQRLAEIRNQATTISELAQRNWKELRGVASRQRVRNTTRVKSQLRERNTDVFTSRAETVDLLAQKLRPRLVAEPENHESAIAMSIAVDPEDSPRKAS
jgi:SMC interacting uncharacterized protein involved in chromosome segregation